MLLAALWFSEEKPSMTTLLRPLVDEINEISKNGNVNAGHVHVYIHVQSILIGASLPWW